MTPTEQYLHYAIKLQTEVTFKIIQQLGEQLFPKDSSKIMELHEIVREALESIHKKAAEHAKSNLENEIDADPKL